MTPGAHPPAQTQAMNDYQAGRYRVQVGVPLVRAHVQSVAVMYLHMPASVRHVEKA